LQVCPLGRVFLARPRRVFEVTIGKPKEMRKRENLMMDVCSDIRRRKEFFFDGKL
jgi:hypothetical protein